jgi:hypothetical protein
MSNNNYNPIPPRVWSRVQSTCTYINGSNNSDYSPVYIPLTNQTVPLAQAIYEDKLIYKGNILQYKGNSSRLTKKQKYTQLAKCFGPNRTKVFATQSQTYTNPNTTGLIRINYQTYPFPNQLVGKPNNISGPFQYDVPNPFYCPSTSLQDGGSLVCGTYANPCTGNIIKTGADTATICNPSYCSDVPGNPIALCWNRKVQTWFPKPRYFMNNSTDKWPINYKGFVSAVKPDPPIISSIAKTVSWTYTNNCEVPITSFIIYVNNIFYTSVPYTTTSYTFTNLNKGIYVFIKSLSYSIESEPSNTISIV